MANFDVAQLLVKAGEGGYTKNPNDAYNYTGGKIGAGMLVGTNWGIGAPTYAKYLKRTPTEADMQAMTYQTAVAIYRQNYWTPIMGDQIQNQSIANILYDTIVNTWDEAFYFARQALKNQNIKVLGSTVVVPRPYFNPDIIKALNTANQQQAFNDIKQQRINFYNAKHNATFGEGWINRLDKFVYSN